MRYVIYYPGDLRDETNDSFEPIEADSKEEIVELVKNRIAEYKENVKKYREYSDAFRSSKGEVPHTPPKFGRRADSYRNDKEKAEMKIALMEHEARIQQYYKDREIYNEEYNEYMNKCPYPNSYSYGEIPELDDIYEYPEEFWEKFLNRK